MTHWMKKSCKRLKSCNATIVLGVVVNIFVCLFGSLITGVFIYYHRFKEEDYENVAETIVTSLDTSEDGDFDFGNNTFDLADILATLEEDAEEITESFDPISVDSNNNVRTYRF